MRVPTKPFPWVPEVASKRIPATIGTHQTMRFDHGGIHPQLDLPPISQKLAARIEQGRSQVREYLAAGFERLKPSCQLFQPPFAALPRRRKRLGPTLHLVVLVHVYL